MICDNLRTKFSTQTLHMRFWDGVIKIDKSSGWGISQSSKHYVPEIKCALHTLSWSLGSHNPSDLELFCPILAHE